MSNSISSFFSSFLSTVHADSEEPTEKATQNASEQPEEAEEAPAQEEEEEEEPEDLHPALRDDCKESKCSAAAKHFEHCQEKVQSGNGFKGEDCVEELCK